MIQVTYRGRPARAEHIHDDVYRLHQDGKSFLVTVTEISCRAPVPPKMDRLLDNFSAFCVGAAAAAGFALVAVLIVWVTGWPS